MLTRTTHFQEKITEGDGALGSPTWRGRTVFLRSLFQKERPDPPFARNFTLGGKVLTIQF
jgi:hypothetical protein